MTRTAGAIIVAAGALSACVGDIGGEPIAPPPPSIVPQDVPVAPVVVEGDGFCVALAENEKLWSVSSEGHAWVGVANAADFQLRIIDPFDSANEVSDTLELSNVQQVQAWSGDDAAVIADGGLWRLEDLARIQMESPVALADSSSLCGDPATNGFLLEQGNLYERRDDDQWWVWNSASSGDKTPSALARYEGECQGRDNLMWLASADGTIWKIEPSVYSTPVKFEALKQIAVRDEALLVLEEDRLWVGPEPWSAWSFPNGTPTQISSAGGLVWAMSGEQLLRFDGEEFVEVDREGSAAVTELQAHPGGVWLVSDGELCHRATAPLIRVDGVRPYTRSLEFDYPIAVQASEAGATVTAELDGEEITLSLDAESGWWEGDARLDIVGWHNLTLSTDGDPSGSRTVAIKRLSSVVRGWEDDILPIYQTNCTGATCHIAETNSTAPDLSTYESWTSLAAKIRSRVVNAEDMPPAASIGPDWKEEHREVILQWLEGGQLP